MHWIALGLTLQLYLLSSTEQGWIIEYVIKFGSLKYYREESKLSGEKLIPQIFCKNRIE